MSDPHADTHAGDGTTGPHASPADHGSDHGHDDHGHAPDDLGPVDVPAWGAGLLGILLGIAVVIAFAIAAGAIG